MCHCRRQEAYQRELEKFAVRRAPLGADRAHRRYWWGLAGRRGVVLTEDAAGRVGFLTAASQLDGIAAVLDARGCREAGLQAALEKVGGHDLIIQLWNAESRLHMSTRERVSLTSWKTPLMLRCRSAQSYAAITEAMQNGHANEPGFDADGDTDMVAAPRADGAGGSGEGSEGSGEGYRDAEREPDGEAGLPEANGGFGGGVLGLAVPRQARTSKREPRQKQVRSCAPDSAVDMCLGVTLGRCGTPLRTLLSEALIDARSVLTSACAALPVLPEALEI